MACLVYVCPSYKPSVLVIWNLVLNCRFGLSNGHFDVETRVIIISYSHCQSRTEEILGTCIHTVFYTFTMQVNWLCRFEIYIYSGRYDAALCLHKQIEDSHARVGHGEQYKWLTVF